MSSTMLNHRKKASTSHSITYKIPNSIVLYLILIGILDQFQFQCNNPYYLSCHAFSVSSTTNTIPSVASTLPPPPSVVEDEDGGINGQLENDNNMDIDGSITSSRTFPTTPKRKHMPFFFARNYEGDEIEKLAEAAVSAVLGSLGSAKAARTISTITVRDTKASDKDNRTVQSKPAVDMEFSSHTKKRQSLFFADEIHPETKQLIPYERNNIESSSSSIKTQSNSKPESIFKRRPSFLPKKTNSPLFFADEIVTTLEENEKEDEFRNNIIKLPIHQQKQKKQPMISKKITSLQSYPDQSKPIVTSFKPKTYNPHPLLTNEHLQTILPVFIRDDPDCAYINPNAKNTFEELFPVAKAFVKKLPSILGIVKQESICDYWDERERIRTHDGDFFDVDYKYVSNNNDNANSNDDDPDDENDSEANEKNIQNESEGIVIIVHGLESNSNSSVCMNMARSFHSRNFDVACMNYRGCSGTPNDTLKQYHAGFTDDLKQLIQLLSDRRWGKSRIGSSSDDKDININGGNIDNKPIYISGFSLGANVVLKCLGELSIDAVTKYNVRGAAVTAAPFHLRPHHRRLIDEPVQRNVYAGTLLKSMKVKLDNLVDQFFDGDIDKTNGKLDYWKIKNATTIAEIEDFMIAPLYGFKDKFDYFEKSASLPLTDDIAVPTFVLNACDDPFFSETFFPWNKDCERGGVAPLKLVRTPKGGHLGHFFHMDNRSDEYEGEEGKEKKKEEKPVASFALSELGRFINHVHTEITKS